MQLTKIIYIICLVGITSCSKPKEHTAPAVNPRDSVSMMRSYGINTLISDSGVMKYRIVAEQWEVNEVRTPPRWTFKRGIFMEQFDQNFHPEAYVQADTAYYFTTKKLWHLIGNVKVKTIDGLRFNSEELFWDQNRHELYSYKFSKVISPERELQGTYFTSDERMQHYTVSNSVGSFIRDDNKKDNSAPNKADTTHKDSLAPKREPITPRHK